MHDLPDDEPDESLGAELDEPLELDADELENDDGWGEEDEDV